MSHKECEEIQQGKMIWEAEKNLLFSFHINYCLSLLSLKKNTHLYDNILQIPKFREDICIYSLLAPLRTIYRKVHWCPFFVLQNINLNNSQEKMSESPKKREKEEKLDKNN